MTTTVLLIDDREAAEGRQVPAERTVRFSFDGTDYEVDLTQDNIHDFIADMAPWIKVARKTGEQPKRRRADPQKAERQAALRAYLKARGREHEVLRPSGYYYPKALWDEFGAWEASLTGT